MWGSTTAAEETRLTDQPKPYRTKFIDFDARPNPKTSHWCIACQRDLDPSKPAFWVHCVDGAPYALHPEDEAIYNALPDSAKGGEMGCFPIGNDCVKKLGVEWAFKAPHFDEMAQQEAARLKAAR
jgi:hypothetical protein